MILNCRVREREKFIINTENVWRELERFDLSQKRRQLRGEMQIEIFHRENPTAILGVWSKYLGHDYNKYTSLLKLINGFVETLEQNYTETLKEYLSKNPRYERKNRRLGTARKIKMRYPHWEGMIDLVVSIPIYLRGADDKEYMINEISLYRIPISFILGETFNLYIHTIQGFVGKQGSTIWELEIMFLFKALLRTKQQMNVEIYMQNPHQNTHLFRNRAKKGSKDHLSLPELFMKRLEVSESHRISVFNSFYYPAIQINQEHNYHVIRPEAGYNSNRGELEFLDIKSGSLADDLYGPVIEVNFYKIKPYIPAIDSL
ncbi:MAG: hypothetical protein NZ908_02005 [Candidatus Micrarchaeota archaeon]|nr:hypothetical protein [Candidatus Micrarchaeota archaeon]